MQRRNTTRLRLLYLLRDAYPPFRPDVDTLFFEELASRGVSTTYSMQAADPSLPSGLHTWKEARVFVASGIAMTSAASRVRRQLSRLRHDTRVLLNARSEDYDLIQVKDLLFTGLLAALSARRKRLPFFYWLSFQYPEADLYKASLQDERYRFIKRIRGHINSMLLYRILFRLSTHAFVQSERMKLDTSLYGIQPHRLTVVPMGIREAEISVDPTSSLSRVRRHCIGYLGSLAGARRLGFLLEVLARLQSIVPDATLLFVGGDEGGDAESALFRLAREYGVADSITVTGHLPRARALEALSAAQVCVSPLYPTPALLAASPTKLIEYFAVPRPAVVTDHPEQTKVIADSGGGLSVPYDVDAFTYALLTLLCDNSLCTRMANAGRQFILRERTYTRIADTVLRRYLDITGISPLELD